MSLKSKTYEDWSQYVSSTCMIMFSAVFLPIMEHGVRMIHFKMSDIFNQYSDGVIKIYEIFW